MILDSHKRAIKLIELLEGDLETAKHEKLKSLPDTIIKRNWLAHWKRSEETDTKITLIHSGKSDYIFDQNEATRMRKKINEAGEILNQYLLEVS